LAVGIPPDRVFESHPQRRWSTLGSKASCIMYISNRINVLK
jgi:hypothetical protein